MDNKDNKREEVNATIFIVGIIIVVAIFIVISNMRYAYSHGAPDGKYGQYIVKNVYRC